MSDETMVWITVDSDDDGDHYEIGELIDETLGDGYSVIVSSPDIELIDKQELKELVEQL